MSVIPPGSKVLVTGVSGYISSFVCDELLAAGYRVRGSSRNTDSSKYLVDIFNKKYGPDKFDTIAVPDITVEGAFDEAVKGVSGIVHLAFDNTFAPDPTMIGLMVSSMDYLLKSALREPTIKSIVFTSSSMAAYLPQPGVEFTVEEDTWDDACVEMAKQTPYNGFMVYGTSKLEVEKLFWQKTASSPFHAASLLPNFNFGPFMAPGRERKSSSASWPVKLWDGDVSVRELGSQWFINTRDSAKLHVIALTDPAANRRRIFGVAAPMSWNMVADTFRKLRPNHKLPADEKNEQQDLSKLPNQFAETLLRKHYNHGWTNLSDTLAETVTTLED